MPLWGKTDAAISAPKYLKDPDNYPAAAPSRDYNGVNNSENLENAYFVDTTEAAVESNRDRGIKTPGWMLYKTYTDGDGNVRNKSEVLVPMKVAAGATPSGPGDAGIANNTATEDLTVPDTVLAITVQPTGQTVVATNAASFSVTATATPDTTITYLWQKQESYETTQWNPAPGTNNLRTYSTGSTVSGTQNSPTTTASTGDKYRVIISAPGKTAQTITSNVVTLTVNAS